MKRLLLLTIFIPFSGVQAQLNTEWAFQVGSSDLQDFNEADVFHVTDSAQNIFISAQYPDIVDFDHSVAIQNLTSNGGQQCFVAKYDKNNNLIWAKNLPETPYSPIRDMVTDAANDLIIVGTFGPTADMDPSAGTTTLTASGSYDDLYIGKYDTDGNLIWAKHIHCSGVVSPNAATVDNDNNIYISGFFSDSLYLDPAGIAAPVVGFYSSYLAKYDADGNYVWGGVIENTTQISQLLTTGNDLFVKGIYSDTLDADISSAGVYTIPHPGSADHLLLKYNLDGEIQWGFGVGGNASEQYGLITVDNENIYMAGNFYGTMLNLDPVDSSVFMGSVNGMSNIFIASYKRDDYDFNWGKRAVASAGQSTAFGLHLNGTNLLLAGTYREDTDFDPSNGIYQLTPQAFESNYVASYNALNGNFEWVVDSEDPFLVNSSSYHPADRRLVLCGAMNGTTNMSFSSIPATITSNGNNDMFVSSYSDIYSNLSKVSGNGLISAYPNPTRAGITLNDPSGELRNCLLYGTDGKVIRDFTFRFNYELPLEHLDAGIYVVQINGAASTETLRIVKAN